MSQNLNYFRLTVDDFFIYILYKFIIFSFIFYRVLFRNREDRSWVKNFPLG